jgi:hypothetical protein
MGGIEGVPARAEGIDGIGTNLTTLLRHLNERRRRRALKRVARMLVELDAVAGPQRRRPTGAQRIKVAGR